MRLREAFQGVMPLVIEAMYHCGLNTYISELYRPVCPAFDVKYCRRLLNSLRSKITPESWHFYFPEAVLNYLDE